MKTFKNHLSFAAGAAALMLMLAFFAYPQQATAASSVLGTSAKRANAIEFIGRSDQNGLTVTHYGYLTHISGLSDDLLFSDSNTRTEATARFTYFATTEINARHELGNIITTAAPGTMTIYFNQTPGANFNDPSSFATNNPIATFAVRYHNVLNVQAPNVGVTTATAELSQLTVDSFTLDGRRHRLGLRGRSGRLFATGQGTRTQVAPPKSFFLLGGKITIAGL